MPKIMVVEDDQSLREIYSIRLTAEGFEVVSAGDGEEALAVAVKERPDLVISDVMMPKISGFDMLDILRSTPETKDIKVIMMTALSSEDQRKRGESLGADKYLVKSQVGIEDVIAAVHEVINGAKVAPGQAQSATAEAQTPPQSAPAPEAPAAVTPEASIQAAPEVPAQPVAPQPAPMPAQGPAEVNPAQFQSLPQQPIYEQPVQQPQQFQQPGSMQPQQFEQPAQPQPGQPLYPAQ